MSKCPTWMLKRFGRFVPGSKAEGGNPWKVFEADGSKPELVLTIVESGHMMVYQGQELLDGISLLAASDLLKVQQIKSDNLVFTCTVKGESRVMRMQFGGRSRAEALEKCSSAIVKVMEYLPVTTQNDITPPRNCAPPPNQSPTKMSAAAEQTGQGPEIGVEPEAIQGLLSVKHLIQRLGERSLSLPVVYSHSPVPQDNLGPFLRACLLDPSFPAFVEEVERELKKLLQD
ncbi:meiotic recombination protein REC114 [Polymixia lowei]